MSEPLNWPPENEVDDGALAEVVRMGEVRMADALAMALAADARAIQQGNILAAITVGLTAVLASITSAEDFDAIAALAIVVGMFGTGIASAISMVAAQPMDFYGRGYSPNEVAHGAKDIQLLYYWNARQIVDSLACNSKVLIRTGNLTKLAQQVTLSAAILSALILIIHLFSVAQ